MTAKSDQSVSLLWLGAGICALVIAAYANHFDNGFHFDDSHAVVDNPAVRDIWNIPRYFSDASTFSVLPLNQSYRPVLQTTLAVDYWVGGGYRPAVFQVDSFVWFAALLACAYGLFVCVLQPCADTADPRAMAMVAVAVFAVHPVGAETVNYVIQRGEILSTLGVAGALLVYARWPELRAYGAWIPPLVLGALAKPPALVFPALMACYALLFDPPSIAKRARVWRDVGLAVGVVAVCGWWMAAHTPPAFTTGASSAFEYWLSQPFIALRYFGTFFAPIGLSADNDWAAVSGAGDPNALAGFVFIGVVVLAAWAAGRVQATRPIAFGLWWFLLALLPTAVTPLAEIANDHRMFFPFVGLALAVTWSAWLLMGRLPASAVRGAALPILILVLLGEAVGVHARNNVWRTDESLWLDVTLKSPTNGRGLMNYGVARMEMGDFTSAIDHFERAVKYTPNYFLLYVNLGVAYGSVQRPADAEAAFRRAIGIAPNDWRAHSFFARWLNDVGRKDEALAEATVAVSLNPLDPSAQEMAARYGTGRAITADGYITISLQQYRAGKFRESIDSAERALTLRPDYAEAYNNVAAGHNALGEWDAGIAAAQEAVRLNPGLQIARNNLAYAIVERAKAAKPEAGPK